MKKVKPISPDEVVKSNNYEKNEIVEFINSLLKKRAVNGYATVDFSEIHKRFSDYRFNRWNKIIKKEYVDAGWQIVLQVDSDSRDPSPRGTWWEFTTKKITWR